VTVYLQHKSTWPKPPLFGLSLPWPTRDLNPNARVHWARLATAKRAYRDACAWSARTQGVRPITSDRLDVGLTFVPPDRRRRDRDNMLSALKSGLDGLADVLGVDDSKWRLTLDVDDEVGGFVLVRIWKGDT
jgi:crossover junction endodeoxyribonuclease RusA